MKFCPHCGNPIKKEQSFCNKCGKHLKTSTQRKSENQIEHMGEQQSYISREERQHHDLTFYKEQKLTIIILVMSKVIKQHSLSNQMKVVKIGINPLVQALMFLVMTLIKVI